MAKLYKIISDQYTWTVSVSTINRYPECLFSKILQNQQESEVVILDTNTFIVDMNGQILDYIVNYMRGYPFKHPNEDLTEYVIYDAKRLGFNELVDNLEKVYKHEPTTLAKPGSPQEPIEKVSSDTDPDRTDIPRLVGIFSTLKTVPGENKGSNYFTETSEPISFNFYGDSSSTLPGLSTFDDSSVKSKKKVIRPGKIQLDT